MIDLLLIFWLVIFILFLLVNISTKSTIFGYLAGFWMLLLGGFVAFTGIQIESGINIVTTGDITVATYQYTDAVLPFSVYSTIWGTFFLGLALYVIYSNYIFPTKTT